MTQEEPKEGKLFESIEQLSQIAQDLVRRKTELAQTEQEPVAFEWDEDTDPIGEVVGFIEGSNYIMVKVHDGKQISLNDDLYDTPPQRKWVGLTGGEISNMFGDWPFKYGEFAEAIEARLKEKNGYAEEKNT